MATAPGPGIGIGIDVGTSSVSFAAWGPEGPEAELTLPNDSPLASGAGAAEQDPERILSIVLEGLAELVRGLGRAPASLCCTGQMHGLLLVGESLEPLTPLLTWQDRRAAALARELDGRLEDRGSGSWMRRGCRLHPGYGGATLVWLRSRGLPPRSHRACAISDWVAARLCGRLATDPSNAASWGIYNLGAASWDGEAVELLELGGELLPPVLEPGAPLGEVGRGLPAAGALVRCGLGDNQASVLAATSEVGLDGTVVANIGTGSQVSVAAPEDAELGAGLSAGLEVRPLLPGRLLCVGASLAGGAAYALLNRFFAEARNGADGGTSEELYELMEAWARSAPPGCDGLECDPSFLGERRGEGLTGSLRGLSALTLSPAHLCRAVLEGMARRLRDLSASTGLPWSRLVGSGNAVRRSAVLREALAVAFGTPLVLSSCPEEAAAGAAMLAVRGASGFR